jgi:hypothetical protein
MVREPRRPGHGLPPVQPALGEHVYTTSAKEYAAVGKAGWHQEGTAWKGL